MEDQESSHRATWNHLLKCVAENKKLEEEMHSNKEPLCNKPIEDRERDDVKTDGLEDDGAGGKVMVERFVDGSSIHYFSGPCGKIKTDKFGNNC
jgi:hypothetical protein